MLINGWKGINELMSTKNVNEQKNIEIEEVKVSKVAQYCKNFFMTAAKKYSKKCFICK